jgi:hypothetical protein
MRFPRHSHNSGYDSRRYDAGGKLPFWLRIASRSADQSAQNETTCQTLCKNLPNHFTEIATLKIEIKPPARGQDTKATASVAFCIPAKHFAPPLRSEPAFSCPLSPITGRL